MSRYPGVTVKILRRSRKIRGDYGYDEHAKKWRGPVERRDPRHYQQPSVVSIARCLNRWCALWIPRESARCPHCHERQAAA